ncbi:tripartite tricarboxylate transporter substrate-binding protein [Candidatus Skiveiella danica]|uniref:tripartite tricarboxylate transporter substrate-binding protein n=1 Tax=Candidatus Skiveiella danica TaxID=3386177 RepID=UPI0039B8D1B5
MKFVPQICQADLVLVVNKDVPVKNLREFLQWAAANHSKVSYGSYNSTKVTWTPAQRIPKYFAQS